MEITLDKSDGSNRILKNSVLITFGLLFFIWGFLSILNTVLVIRFREIFGLGFSITSLISIVFYTSYIVVPLFAANMVRNWGYKLSMIVGLYATGLGCMILHFALTVDNYYFFLFSFCVQAIGITCLQVGANLYIVFMGDPKKAASRLSFMQGFNAIGALLAPVFASKMVTDMFGFTTDEAQSSMNLREYTSALGVYVQTPYIILSIILFFLTIYFVFVAIPEFSTQKLSPLNKLQQSSRRVHVMHFRQLRLGAFALFAYVGAEVSLGSILESNYQQYSPYYWGAAMVGRFVGSALLLKYSPRKAIAFCGAFSIVLLLVAIFSSGAIVLWSLLAIGLFNSIMFPTIFCLGLNGLGKFSENGASIMIMSVVGAGVIPFMAGNYTKGLGLEYGLIIPVICYFYIIYYGLEGSKFERLEGAESDK